MPLPEGYLPRRGDELLIRAKVSFDVEPDDEDVHLEPIGAEWKKVMVPLADVHAIHCRKWDKGDKVIWQSFEGAKSTVIAVYKKWVWIKDEFSDDTEIVSANELEPYVDPEELAVETMTEAELLAGLEPLIIPEPNIVPDPAPGSQSIVGDDEEIKF
jgi:hypothetical protein